MPVRGRRGALCLEGVSHPITKIQINRGLIALDSFTETISKGYNVRDYA